jgi:hypothetical protein
MNRLSGVILSTVLLTIPLCLVAADEPQQAATAKKAKPCRAISNQKGTTERKLFDGKTLTGWKVTNFGGEGDVTVEKSNLVLGFGSFMTGVTYAGEDKLPQSDYEVILEAQRVDGTDFFCGLTVPYHDSHFSLIVGGWGGGVVGISSIDGYDASENETTKYIPFKKGVWYCIRLRVTDEQIEAWIDDEQIVSYKTKGHKLTTRVEVDLSKPFGIAAFDTRAALRNIRLRTWSDSGDAK